MARRSQWLQQNTNYLKVLSNSSEIIEIHPNLKEIYSLAEFEKLALAVLPAGTRAFFNNGADCENSKRENEAAFSRFVFIPRIFESVPKTNLKVELFGTTFQLPIGIAPTGLQRLAHREGEIASARSAANFGIPVSVSHLATTSMEEIVQEVKGKTSAWIQIYLYKDRELSKNYIKRAELAGYTVLLMTIDARRFGKRLSEWRNRFNAPETTPVPNLECSIAKCEPMLSDGQHPFRSELFFQIEKALNPSFGWDDLVWLKSVTSMKVVVKGIMTPEDAESAIQYGADGIYVSNHGGRQLDFVPASIEALPMIAKQVAGRVPVLFDGGIRKGTDVLKALAFGADMVFLGRPVLYGIAVGGSNGLDRTLDILEKELRQSMNACGIADVGDVSREAVVRRFHFN